MLSNEKIYFISVPKALDILYSALIVISLFPASIMAICERETVDSSERVSCVKPLFNLIFLMLTPSSFLKSLHIFIFYAMLLTVTVAMSDKL